MFALIAGVIHRTGLPGVALLMLVENVSPIIPSELILPMAGYEAARGAFSPLLAIVAGTLGSVVGGTVWYAIGRSIGLERMARFAAHGAARWLTLSPCEILRAHAWFERWGLWAVLIGRALPGVRGVICIPAGIARMRLGSFIVASSLGALAWSTLLVASGYLLNRHFDQVGRWLNPVTDVFVLACLAVYLVRVVRFRSVHLRGG